MMPKTKRTVRYVRRGRSHAHLLLPYARHDESSNSEGNEGNRNVNRQHGDTLNSARSGEVVGEGVNVGHTDHDVDSDDGVEK